MSIKEIIVHLGPDSRSAARLDIAATMAKAHGARLAGVFVKADPGAPGFWWVELSKAAMADWAATLAKAAREAEVAFGERLRSDGLDGDWRVAEGDVIEVLTLCARHADLTVIGQTDPDQPAYPESMPDEVVLGAGGPVLVVPYAGRFRTVGSRVMVAWNGAREAARAVRDAMPILRKAERVMVRSIGGTRPSGIAGAGIGAYLARHGVKAEIDHEVLGDEDEAVSSSLKTVGGFGFQKGGPLTSSRRPALARGDVGEALLTAVADAGADLLVMGAYGHSRLREFVLGGATREILGSMTVPVLMSA